ncbi:hypothetical protein FHU38_002298 [Saccharomonospora amisosensis]|uniref:Uncharacterized protein n=1 Tax=Saccharomonospora amisosensis TaxID=1128677 RepID=A0A7X5UQN9_9PSEU|nr:hypothetical protein [Saccharomonospora amisosensis]NIJ11954.1 hypothetical protein [Saccharomonospora amisosensis]
MPAPTSMGQPTVAASLLDSIRVAAQAFKISRAPRRYNGHRSFGNGVSRAKGDKLVAGAPPCSRPSGTQRAW